MKAFEIHTFHDGRWKIDSVFDDAELAVLEARRLNDGKHQLGVRVVEEEFDEHSRRTMVRTIFHSSSVGDPGRTQRQSQPRAGAEPARRSATIPTASEPASGPPGAGDSAGHRRLIPKLTVVLVLALAAFFGIQSLIAAS